MIVDDYGHHPAEIEATLDAAQRGFDRRVVVAFQPHRYTRTQAALRRVHARLQQGRRRPRDRRLPGRREAHRGRDRRSAGRGDPRARPPRGVVRAPTRSRSRSALAEVVEPGDLVIALGAGDINASARELLADPRRGRHAAMTPGNRRVAPRPAPRRVLAPASTSPTASRRRPVGPRPARVLAGAAHARRGRRSSPGVGRRGLGRAPARDDEPALRDHRGRRRRQRPPRRPTRSSPRAASQSARTCSSPISTRRRRASWPTRGSPRRRWRAACRDHRRARDRAQGRGARRARRHLPRRPPTASRSRSSRPTTRESATCRSSPGSAPSR